MPLKFKKPKPPKQSPIDPKTGKSIDIFEELKKCKADPEYFITHYVYIDTDDGLGLFNLWPFQRDTLRDIIGNRFNVILKARQMGISQLCAAFVVWFSLFYKRKTSLCIANKQETAGELLDKIKIILRHLPEWMLTELGAIEDSDRKFEDRFEEFNKLSIIFKNDSKIKVSATTDSAGRGLTVDCLILDEAASVPNAEKVWTAIYPTIEKRGRAIVLSTPEGSQNWFHGLYSEAIKGINGFNPVKLHWSLRPNRTPEWGEQKLREIGESRFAQEYDCQFLGSGAPLLKGSWLKTITESWIKPPYYKGDAEEDGLWFWEKPEDSHFYILGADTASGEGDVSAGDSDAVLKTDYSAACIYDRDTGQFVAEYYGKIRPYIFAEILYKLAIMYNNALLIFDNSGGYSGPIYDRFQQKNYWNIYREPKGLENPNAAVDLLDPGHKPGITLTKANRNKIISDFEEYVTTSDGRPLFYSERFLTELVSFVFNPKKERYEAAPGAHDDLVFAHAIALHASTQWSLYAAQSKFMTSSIVQALRLAKKRSIEKSDNPNRLPVTAKSYTNKDSKFQKYFSTYYTDKKTKTDLSGFVGDGNSNDDKGKDDGLQKSALDHII